MSTDTPHFTDFLVIGGGIAGLSFALEAANVGKVTVLFKRELTLSATSWAQGGIAAVSATSIDDKLALHAEDTLKVGCGLANPKIVEIVVTEGAILVRRLIEWGVPFDRDLLTDEYHLHQEGGHSRRRIFHAADATGSAIHETLLKRVLLNQNITCIEHAFAIDLLRHGEQSILGAYVLLKDNHVDRFFASKTVIATGGAGKVYLYTSNPDIATGDGIAMAYRAGGSVANMEFFQFHPTCLYHPHAKAFLITEALRGEGAKLRNLAGEQFMGRYHKDKELAPRDIVARAIDDEMKKSGTRHVYLDALHLAPSFVREHFPTIYGETLKYGIDITKEWIPVVPAAHFCCGGIVSDEDGRASNLSNLFAIGECAHSGLHGANRLASNSLLEGLVFGSRAAKAAAKDSRYSITSLQKLAGDIPPWDKGLAVPSDEKVTVSQDWDEIRRFMWNYVGIVRSDSRLKRAKARLELLEEEIRDYYFRYIVSSDLLELRNLCVIARLIIESATLRRESRGLHYTSDYPESKEEFNKDTLLKHATN